MSNSVFTALTSICNIAEFILGNFFGHFFWLSCSHYEMYELSAYCIFYIALDNLFYFSLRKNYDLQAVVEHTTGATVA